MKLESTLPKGAFFVHLAVILDVVVLLFVVTLITTGIVPKYGFNVKTPPSEFLINIQGEYYVVSVTAGESPVVFFDNRRLENGVAGLEKELDDIVAKEGSEGAGRITIILNMDQAVSRAMEQNLIEMVLEHGLTCAVAGSPLD